MKLSLRDWSAIGLGNVLGVVFCEIAEIYSAGRAVDWPKTFDSAKNISQVIGVIVAGGWAYVLFVRQRLGRVRANLEHSVLTAGLSDGRKLIRAGLEIQNVGAVLIRPPHGT